MSLAGFVASQRADHGVPHATSCRALGLSESWFYKWRERKPTPAQARRAELKAAIRAYFDASDGDYGSPRITADLRDAGWKVGENTVARLMAAMGLRARPPRRKRRCTTRQDRRDPVAPDLLGRDFSASRLNEKWSGDLTEIPTDEGPIYLASVEDLCSRRVPGFALGEHHDAPLAEAALKMAVAVRGGEVRGVIFHSDRGSEYTARTYAKLCVAMGITRSMGRVGSALDNAASESFNSTLEFECLRKHHFATKAEARYVVATWIDQRYNRTRRHSSIGMIAPVDFEARMAAVGPDEEQAA